MLPASIALSRSDSGMLWNGEIGFSVSDVNLQKKETTELLTFQFFINNHADFAEFEIILFFSESKRFLYKRLQCFNVADP